MMTARRLLAGLLAALAMPAVALDHGGRGPGPRLEPYVGMAGGRPVACGFHARLAQGAALYAVTLAIVKRPPGTVLRLAVSASEAGATRPVASAAVATEGEVPAFQPVPAADGESLALVAETEHGGDIMQALMLRGGTITLAVPTTPVTLTFSGPMPQGVRALYLNCTGDLYPGER